MNITFNHNEFEKYLSRVNDDFRSKIVKQYFEFKQRAYKCQYDTNYDAAGLSAGKLCELLFRFIENELKGTYTSFDKSISNFLMEASKFESYSTLNKDESLRILIPRCIIFIYTLRNKRNIGHLAGEVLANKIDIETIQKMADWAICELIRIYHGVTIEEAEELILSLSSKSFPFIWEVNGKKRILNTTISAKDKVLLLSYAHIENSVFLSELLDWTEYKNASDFKTKVIQPLHNDKFLEFDPNLGMVFLSPAGILKVENTILPNLT